MILLVAEPLIDDADPDALLADKAYDADPFIDTLAQRESLHSHPGQGQPRDPESVRFCALLRTRPCRTVLRSARTLRCHRHTL